MLTKTLHNGSSPPTFPDKINILNKRRKASVKQNCNHVICTWSNDNPTQANTVCYFHDQNLVSQFWLVKYSPEYSEGRFSALHLSYIAGRFSPSESLNFIWLADFIFHSNPSQSSWRQMPTSYLFSFHWIGLEHNAENLTWETWERHYVQCKNPYTVDARALGKEDTITIPVLYLQITAQSLFCVLF